MILGRNVHWERGAGQAMLAPGSFHAPVVVVTSGASHVLMGRVNYFRGDPNKVTNWDFGFETLPECSCKERCETVGACLPKLGPKGYGSTLPFPPQHMQLPVQTFQTSPAMVHAPVAT